MMEGCVRNVATQSCRQGHGLGQSFPCWYLIAPIWGREPEASPVS